MEVLMFKINEVADQLKVSRVVIFEKLLSQREYFDPYISKVNGVTYISDTGVQRLREILFGEPQVEKEMSSERDDRAHSQKPLMTGESQRPIEVKKAAEQSIQEDEKHLFKSNDYLEKEYAKDLESLGQLRQRIRQQRNQLLTIDSDLKRKEDAILHYHDILIEDVDWIMQLEKRLDIMVSEVDINPFPDAPEFIMPGEEKNGIKKIFKR